MEDEGSGGGRGQETESGHGTSTDYSTDPSRTVELEGGVRVSLSPWLLEAGSGSDSGGGGGPSLARATPGSSVRLRAMGDLGGGHTGLTDSSGDEAFGLGPDSPREEVGLRRFATDQATMRLGAGVNLASQAQRLSLGAAVDDRGLTPTEADIAASITYSSKIAARTVRAFADETLPAPPSASPVPMVRGQGLSVDAGAGDMAEPPLPSAKPNTRKHSRRHGGAPPVPPSPSDASRRQAGASGPPSVRSHGGASRSSRGSRVSRVTASSTAAVSGRVAKQSGFATEGFPRDSVLVELSEDAVQERKMRKQGVNCHVCNSKPGRKQLYSCLGPCSERGHSMVICHDCIYNDKRRWRLPMNSSGEPLCMRCRRTCCCVTSVVGQSRCPYAAPGGLHEGRSCCQVFRKKRVPGGRQGNAAAATAASAAAAAAALENASKLSAPPSTLSGLPAGQQFAVPKPMAYPGGGGATRGGGAPGGGRRRAASRGSRSVRSRGSRSIRSAGRSIDSGSVRSRPRSEAAEAMDHHDSDLDIGAEADAALTTLTGLSSTDLNAPGMTTQALLAFADAGALHAVLPETTPDNDFDAAFGLGLAGNRRSSMGSTDAFGGRFGALPSVPETGRTGGARDEFKPREATLVLRPDGASFAYAPSTVEIVGDVVSVFNGSMASGQHPVLYFGSLHADSVDASPSKLIARIPLPGGDIDPARYPRRVKLQVKTRGRPEVLWESERHFTLRVAESAAAALQSNGRHSAGLAHPFDHVMDGLELSLPSLPVELGGAGAGAGGGGHLMPSPAGIRGASASPSRLPRRPEERSSAAVAAALDSLMGDSSDGGLGVSPPSALHARVLKRSGTGGSARSTDAEMSDGVGGDEPRVVDDDTAPAQSSVATTAAGTRDAGTAASSRGGGSKGARTTDDDAASSVPGDAGARDVDGAARAPARPSHSRLLQLRKSGSELATSPASRARLAHDVLAAVASLEELLTAARHAAAALQVSNAGATAAPSGSATAAADSGTGVRELLRLTAAAKEAAGSLPDAMEGALSAGLAALDLGKARSASGSSLSDMDLANASTQPGQQAAAPAQTGSQPLRGGAALELQVPLSVPEHEAVDGDEAMDDGARAQSVADSATPSVAMSASTEEGALAPAEFRSEVLKALQERDTLDLSDRVFHLASGHTPTEGDVRLAFVNRLLSNEEDARRARRLFMPVVALAAERPESHYLYRAWCSDTMLASVAHRLPCVEEVHLMGQSHVGDAGIAALAEICGPRLRFLDMRSCTTVGAAAYRALGDHCPNLEHLNQHHGAKRLREADLLHVAQRCPKLQFVSWRKCTALTDSVLRALGTHCRALRVLYVSFCRKITSHGLAALADGVPGLQELHVHDTDVEGDTAMERVFDCCGTLKVFDGAMCSRLTDRIIHLLTRNGSLVKLDVGYDSRLTSESVASIARCVNLRELSLTSWGSLRDEDLALLAASCPRLELLKVPFCSAITDAGLCAVAAGCTSLKDLDVLGVHLRKTRVTDASLDALATHCPRLEKISVGRTMVTDAGLIKLFRACPGLEVVDVQCVKGVTNETVFEAARRLPQLRELNVSRSLAVTWLPPQLERLEKLVLNDSEDREAVGVDFPPVSHWHGGDVQLRSFLRNVDSGYEPSAFAKVMLMGYRGAGKSSVLAAMRNAQRGIDPAWSPHQEGSTWGVDVSMLEVTFDGPGADNPPINVVFYDTADYGYHATHGLFMTRYSLYIVVVNLVEENPALRAMEWIELIQTRVPGARVLIIGTHTDQIGTDADRYDRPGEKANQRLWSIKHTIDEWNARWRKKLSAEIARAGSLLDPGTGTRRSSTEDGRYPSASPTSPRPGAAGGDASAAAGGAAGGAAEGDDGGDSLSWASSGDGDGDDDRNGDSPPSGGAPQGGVDGPTTLTGPLRNVYFKRLLRQASERPRLVGLAALSNTQGGKCYISVDWTSARAADDDTNAHEETDVPFGRPLGRQAVKDLLDIIAREAQAEVHDWQEHTPRKYLWLARRIEFVRERLASRYGDKLCTSFERFGASVAELFNIKNRRDVHKAVSWLVSVGIVRQFSNDQYGKDIGSRVFADPQLLGDMVRRVIRPPGELVADLERPGVAVTAEDCLLVRRGVLTEAALRELCKATSGSTSTGAATDTMGDGGDGDTAVASAGEAHSDADFNLIVTLLERFNLLLRVDAPEGSATAHHWFSPLLLEHAPWEPVEDATHLGLAGEWVPAAARPGATVMRRRFQFDALTAAASRALFSSIQMEATREVLQTHGAAIGTGLSIPTGHAIVVQRRVGRTTFEVVAARHATSSLGREGYEEEGPCVDVVAWHADAPVAAEWALGTLGFASDAAHSDESDELLERWDLFRAVIHNVRVQQAAHWKGIHLSEVVPCPLCLARTPQRNAPAWHEWNTQSRSVAGYVTFGCGHRVHVDLVAPSQEINQWEGEADEEWAEEDGDGGASLEYFGLQPPSVLRDSAGAQPGGGPGAGRRSMGKPDAAAGGGKAPDEAASVGTASASVASKRHRDGRGGNRSSKRSRA